MKQCGIECLTVIKVQDNLGNKAGMTEGSMINVIDSLCGQDDISQNYLVAFPVGMLNRTAGCPCAKARSTLK